MSPFKILATASPWLAPSKVRIATALQLTIASLTAVLHQFRHLIDFQTVDPLKVNHSHRSEKSILLNCEGNERLLRFELPGFDFPPIWYIARLDR